ncbi:MAG TPA: helix-turn-helix transcriptional regulator [Thermoanaerobaculia bacterium]|nr:helix-turn-helix transcriptional regulator [Thermoanaerobaculia bacterium]
MAAKKRRRNPRTFTDDHRKRLDRAVTLYLLYCYRQGTAARVSEFAKFLGRDRAYISRTAGAILGMSLGNFLRARRLAYAAQLLRTTQLPMKEIALKAGFGTTATFYRRFTALHKMPPAVFREVTK